jgi:hypothetical protein
MKFTVAQIMRGIAFLAVVLGVAIPLFRQFGHFLTPLELVCGGSLVCLGWAVISWISYTGPRRAYWFSFWLIFAAGGFFLLLSVITLFLVFACVADWPDRVSSIFWLLGAIGLTWGMFRFIHWRIDVLNRNRSWRPEGDRPPISASPDSNSSPGEEMSG